LRSVRFLIVAVCFAATTLAGTANAQQKQTIRVVSAWAGLWDTTQPTLCSDRGEFAKAGLDIDITFSPGATVMALATRSADISYSPGTSAILAAFRQGVKLKIISTEFRGQNDTFFYVRSDSPIRTVNDLRGKTVGYPRQGGPTENLIIGLAAERNLEFKRVATGSTEATHTLVMTGQIDVGYAFPPALIDKVGNGQLRVLFAGDLVKSQHDITTRVVTVREEFLQNNRAAVVKFLRVLDQCIDWSYANQDAAVKSYAAINKVDNNVARRSLEFYDRAALAFGPISGLDQVMKEAIRSKFIDKPLSASEQQQLIDIVYTTPKK
jgi:NitT/TauT family transport system substrate-binding protein